jgi:hypothetical protein
MGGKAARERDHSMMDGLTYSKMEVLLRFSPPSREQKFQKKNTGRKEARYRQPDRAQNNSSQGRHFSPRNSFFIIRALLLSTLSGIR